MLSTSKRIKFKNIKVSVPTVKVLLFLVCVLFVGSIASRLYWSTSLAVKNKELEQYYVQKTDLEKEIAALKYESSNLSCLTSLVERAAMAGFMPLDDSLIALDVQGSDQFASASNTGR